MIDRPRWWWLNPWKYIKQLEKQAVSDMIRIEYLESGYETLVDELAENNIIVTGKPGLPEFEHRLYSDKSADG